jgi:hypothetical protein
MTEDSSGVSVSCRGVSCLKAALTVVSYNVIKNNDICAFARHSRERRKSYLTRNGCPTRSGNDERWKNLQIAFTEGP